MNNRRKYLSKSILAVTTLLCMAACSSTTTNTSLDSTTGDTSSNDGTSTSSNGGGSASSSGGASGTSSGTSSSQDDSDLPDAIESGVYWRAPAIASSVCYINEDNMSDDEEVMITSVQGILAQTEAKIYIDDNSGGVKKWFDQMQTALGYTVKTYTDPWVLLDDVKSLLPTKKLVVYASVDSSGDKFNTSIDNAASVAGVEGYVMSNTALVSKMMTHGFSLGKNVTESTTREIWEEYKDRLNNKMLVNQKPVVNVLRDYAIASKCMCTYFDYEGDDDELQNDIESWIIPNAPILGWCEDELDFVATNSALGKITIASDYAISLSFTSGYKPGADLAFSNYKKRDIKVESGKHYVAILMSDGDNVQWVERDFVVNKKFYGSEYRGNFPMTWAVSPSLGDLCPAALEGIYSMGTEYDDFVAGPSGIGYTEPTVYNSSAMDDFGAKTAGYMKKTGLHSVNMIDPNCDTTQIHSISGQDQVTGGFWSAGGYYIEGCGGVYWSDDKPFIANREALYESSNNDTNFDALYSHPERVAQRVNSYKTDPTDISGYTVVIAHAWTTGTLSYINKFVNDLDDHVVVVSGDELIQMVTDNVPHVDVETINDKKPSDFLNNLCALDTSAFKWKQVKDTPVTADRTFDFATDNESWVLGHGPQEYDKASFNSSWPGSGDGSILLDGSDMGDTTDPTPNSWMYNMFNIGTDDKYMHIRIRGRGSKDANLRIHIYHEKDDGTVEESYLTDGFSSVDSSNYYLVNCGEEAITCSFSLSAYAGQKVLISLEQDDNKEGDGENVYVDYVHINDTAA